MDSTMIPDAVKKNDLKSEVDEKTAHSEVADTMSNFLNFVLKGEKMDIKDTDSLI